MNSAAAPARVVIAGASGLIGRALVEDYTRRGATVTTVGRGPSSDVTWSDTAGLRAALDGADIVVNLAGKNVNCRYTARNRAEIIRSRVESTRAIGEAIASVATPPALWINASSATIYPNELEIAHTEESTAIGEGFSPEVVRVWEEELFRPRLPHTRRIALRITIVLAREGFLQILSRIARTGFGGPQLDGPWPRFPWRAAAGTDHHYGTRGGEQRFSWIHIDDVVGAIAFIEQHPDLEGPINLAAPTATDNRGLMATLRQVLRIPVGIPLHRWLLEPGAWIIRTETELLFKSRWVHPRKLLDAGYAFQHPELEGALRQALKPATIDR